MSFRFTHAFVRPPSPALAACELLHVARQPIDFGRAAAQHRGYIAALQGAGLAAMILPEAPDLADATFVEDVALILDDAAILCRPGAASRLGEVDLIRPTLRHFRAVHEIRGPGTLEGGDVLRADRTLFVGQSTRTNAEGIAQLRQIAEPLGFAVKVVPIGASLHLKTAITSPAPGLMLANLAWVDVAPFRDFEVMPIPVSEPWGANILPLNGRVLVAGSAPQTADLLRQRGLEVQSVDVSELQKAEAGLTCLSVLFSESAGRPALRRS